MTTIYKTLGDHLYRLRGRRTQAEMATRLNLSQSYYARLEKGEGRLQLHQLIDLAAEFGLTIVITNGQFNLSKNNEID